MATWRGAMVCLALVGSTWSAPRKARADGHSEKVDAIFAEHIKDSGPGGVCLVIEGGKVVHTGFYGLADIEAHTPFSLDSAFDLASVSKQFTGLAAAISISRGELALSDDARKHLPELPVYDEKRPITVGDIAHMVSGLPGYEALLDSWDGKTNLDVLAAVAAEKHLAFPTGSRYEYSNTDYNLLSTIVARAAKAGDFGEVARTRIFEPLGMKQTAVLMKAGQAIPGRVRGYKEKTEGAGDWIKDQEDTPGIVGDGSVFSTPRDLVTYDHAIRDAKVITPEIRSIWLTKGPKEPDEGVHYALGWNLDKHADHERMQHSGSWAGTSTFMAHYLDPQLTVIVLLNVSNAGAQAYAEAVAELYLANGD